MVVFGDDCPVLEGINFPGLLELEELHSSSDFVVFPSLELSSDGVDCLFIIGGSGFFSLSRDDVSLPGLLFRGGSTPAFWFRGGKLFNTSSFDFSPVLLVIALSVGVCWEGPEIGEEGAESVEASDKAGLFNLERSLANSFSISD